MTSVPVQAPESLPAGEHIGSLCDPGSFLPIRTEVRPSRGAGGVAGDGVLCGSGTVDGRPIFCYEQDPTVLGGSLGEMHAASICRVLDLAGRFRRPVVGIHRSGGARIQEGVGSLAAYGRMFARHVRLRGVVPQIALIFGPCAGGAAYGPALMDFVLMPESGAFMFLTGPEVVREVTGERVDFEGLGGAGVHGRSGLASLVGRDVAHTIGLARTLLDHLAFEESAGRDWSVPTTDPAALVPADPRRVYDVRTVIAGIVDEGSFLELRRSCAPNLVCGLARLEGRSIGVVANQPLALAGTIDAAASRKGAWFVETCDRFGLPLAVLVDTPGFLPGRSQELAGVIPHGAAFLRAFASADVPKATVVLRKAYGGAYIVMNASDLGADAAFAWPQAEIAVMGARGAVRILERRRLSDAADPDRVRRQLEAEYREHHCTPWPAAHGAHIDEVIDPCETRLRLVRSLLG